MIRQSFSTTGFVVRWVVAIVLVFATFNPHYSFFQWALDAESGNLPVKILIGLVLLVGYLIFFRATWRSIGPYGVALLVILFAVLGWVLVDQGIVSAQINDFVIDLVLLVLATILAVGLSWSHIRRRLSGQVDADDISD